MRNTLLAVAAAALVGCVGGIDNPTNDPNGSNTPTDPPADGTGGGGTGPAAAEARSLFETNVYPIINAKCVGCHSINGPVGNVTGFVGTALANAYTTAVGYQALIGNWTPTGAPILTKITPGPHNGQTYSADNTSQITAWLAKEIEARAGGTDNTQPGGETPSDATTRIVKEWSGCMSQANFTAAGMKAWGTMRADNSQCQTCHAGGAYGQIALANDDKTFFTVIDTNKYYMAQYFSVDLSAGVTAAKMTVNMRSFTAVGGDLAPHTTHPRFTVTGSTGMVALQKFYDLTMAAKTAGTCGAPTITN